MQLILATIARFFFMPRPNRHPKTNKMMYLAYQKLVNSH